MALTTTRAENASSDADKARVDRVVDWLLNGLAWEASVFHIGQYCGRWRASTAGKARASFHLVLKGRCWLHLPGRVPLALGPRDGVFLMRDVPHFISPYADPDIECAAQPMRPLSATAPQPSVGETGLACGFFSFHGLWSDLIANALPQYLVLRADDANMVPAGALFDLMVDEARRNGSEPSGVMDRLSGLLFFYCLRHAVRHAPHVHGIWMLLRRPGFTPLISDLLNAPARPWSVADMAKRVKLSRAAFFRQFSEAGGQSPLQFLMLVRMHIATQLLERGDSINRTAEAVGYESYAAFSRVFKRTTGEQPGAWQRNRTRNPVQLGTNEHKPATLSHGEESPRS